MPKRPVILKPHKVLASRAAALPPSDITGTRIRRLISDMKDTLVAAPDGVGLAAPQIGESVRIFLISEEAEVIDANLSKSDFDRLSRADAPQKAWEYRVFINPTFTKRSRAKKEMAEGCLSVPRKFGFVSRSEKVFLEWYDESGKKHARGFSKFFARVLQHEMDHLEGKLITDRARKLFDNAAE